MTKRNTRTRKLKQGQFLLLQTELSRHAQFNDRAWVYRELRNMGYRWDVTAQRWVKLEVTQNAGNESDYAGVTAGNPHG